MYEPASSKTTREMQLCVRTSQTFVLETVDWACPDEVSIERVVDIRNVGLQTSRTFSYGHVCIDIWSKVRRYSFDIGHF